MEAGRTSVTAAVQKGIDNVRCRHIIGYQDYYQVGQSGHDEEVEGEEQRATRGRPWPYRSFQEPEWHQNVTRSPGPEVAVRESWINRSVAKKPTSRIKTGRLSKTCSDNSRTERWASSCEPNSTILCGD